MRGLLRNVWRWYASHVAAQLMTGTAAGFLVAEAIIHHWL